jgi:toxin CcdB
MARFDVHPRRDGEGLLLDVQSDHLYVLPTRMVVPLLPEGAALPPLRDLNPVLTVGTERLAMMTQYMAAVPTRLLGRPVDNLTDQTDDITRALGILLNGF